MYDFSSKILKFHDDCVTLARALQDKMRERRDTNLDRIKDGLDEMKKPKVVESIAQGGYKQHTMTQPPEADPESRYDIDLGIVFEENEVAGARTTRHWVCDAIARKATGMKNEPEAKKKCVRIVYEGGYQCDFPVFRRSGAEGNYLYELSSGDDWYESDPRSMNAWVAEEISRLSPESSGNHQLRRIIRLGKFYAKTHAARLSKKFPGGLLMTALLIDAYVSVKDRDDESFRETLRGISGRSKFASVYANGVVISDDKDTGRIGRLIHEAGKSVAELDELDDVDCTSEDAQKAWRKVFRHKFFGESAATTSQIHTNLSGEEKDKRIDATIAARKQGGGGTKPWVK